MYTHFSLYVQLKNIVERSNKKQMMWLTTLSTVFYLTVFRYIDFFNVEYIILKTI